ncbi:MAG: cytochrome c oxidase subunit 3 [Flavobacteriaceae bacterium]
MGTTATSTAKEKIWDGGNEPLGASYGKLMMWFFILSDSLTFTGFLIAYGFMRYKFIDIWPIADEVFNHFPFIHGDNPMYFVALMTFILIFSSVTMVLAVDAGHQMKKNKVVTYMALTIAGGLFFIGSQAYEWTNFIKGTYGAVETKGGAILQFVDLEGNRLSLDQVAKPIPTERVENTRSRGLWFTEEAKRAPYTTQEVIEGLKANPNVLVRTEFIYRGTDEQKADTSLHPTLNKDKHKVVLTREASIERIQDAAYVVKGASHVRNEYGNKLFANLFFFITGFHGFHVSIGILLNIIIFINVLLGTYERRGSYEMVEKVGLYWHFVDLVWVFVFTFFYLV